MSASTKIDKDAMNDERIRLRSGKITISPSQVYDLNELDFVKPREKMMPMREGGFGCRVEIVLHKPSGTLMAKKCVRLIVGGQQEERQRVIKELDFVLMFDMDYAYVVRFYGVKYLSETTESHIYMEMMDMSLDKLYKYVYGEKRSELPEWVLGKVVVAAVNALNYLKETYKIMHRDVKPSNMLVNRRGEIKLCDFGISGKLIDSLAGTHDVGSQLYMAVSVLFNF